MRMQRGEAPTTIPPFPSAGRSYALSRLIGPGETAPSGRARLDVIADWLQHVAYADVLDARVDGEAVWVLRRNRLRIERFPRFGETIELRTACSGYGASWAERRTSIRGDRGAAVEAVALWVALDPVTLRPTRMQGFLAVYGSAAGGRRVRARLDHPPPSSAATSVPWRLHVADLDVAGHVNNAAYWRALEEHLPGLDAAAPLSAEAEHHAPGQAGAATFLSSDGRAWIVGPDDLLHASFALSPLDGG